MPVSNISESLLENGKIADSEYLPDKIDSSFASDEENEVNDIEDTDTESDYGIQDSLYPYIESIENVRKVVKKIRNCSNLRREMEMITLHIDIETRWNTLYKMILTF